MITAVIIVAVLVILLAVVILFIRKANKEVVDEQPPVVIADDCCGSHAVCERDTLLSKTNDIIYFDDEELDVLRNIPAEDFTPGQIAMIEDVFFSLREQDVAGWIRSIQLRGIELPIDIRDQALLIIAERREHTLETFKKNSEFRGAFRG